MTLTSGLKSKPFLLPKQPLTALAGLRLIWEAKFRLGRRSQDSEKGEVKRSRRGGGWVKIYYQPRRGRARNLAKDAKESE